MAPIPMQYEDARRAMQWGLDASFLESKTDSSALVCLCQAVVDAKGLREEARELFSWALGSGAQMSRLTANSRLFFMVAPFAGAAWIWGRLFDAGFPLDRVQLRGAGREVVRSSTKLGLLCTPPYCFGEELPELIALLVDRGVDPNERDSEGYAPLGLLNEQLRLHESGEAGVGCNAAILVRGVDSLLSRGARPESILPGPEAYAAKAIKERLRAKIDQDDLISHVGTPRSRDGSVRSSPPKSL